MHSWISGFNLRGVDLQSHKPARKRVERRSRQRFKKYRCREQERQLCDEKYCALNNALSPCDIRLGTVPSTRSLKKGTDNHISRQTVFAMPILDWNADRASAVVTRHAWLYLAITLPLTILVLSVWFGWIFVSARMHRATDENARASVFRRRREAQRSIDEFSEDATDSEHGSV